MPATPPPPGSDSDKQEPFQLHYDTLVVAVGAYSQSEYCVDMNIQVALMRQYYSI